MTMVRRLNTAVLRHLGSGGADAIRRLSTRAEAPTAVIHLERPFSSTLRVKGPARPATKGEQTPEELAARLDDAGAQVRVRLLSREDMVALQAYGADDDPNVIHLCGAHDVEAPNHIQLRRLDQAADPEAKLRRLATLRRLRSRGILVKRQVPPESLTPAGPISGVKRSVHKVGQRDSASWIIGRLQVIGAKISRGVRAFEK